MFGIAAAALGGALLGSRSSRSSQPSAPERMSYEDAYSQAEDVLTPQFESNREQVLTDVDKNLISRGFYGQAPGDYMKSGVMGDMQSQFEGQKSQYAQNLRQNEYAQDYQVYQHQLQQYNEPDPFWSTIGSIAGSFMGGQGGEALFNWLTG